MPDQTISVVILTTGNNSKFLVDSLNSLLNQTVFPNEVVIVCDKPNSCIVDLISENKKKLPIKTIFRDYSKGIGFSRNVGITHSNSDVVAFLDDDAVASPQWVEGMLEAYTDPKIVAVSGRVTDKSVGLPQIISYINRRFDLGSAMRTTHSLIGCNMSFRKSLFAKIGPFDPKIDYGPDELEVADRINQQSDLQIMYSPQATVMHDYARSWKNLIWKTYRQGQYSVKVKLTHTGKNKNNNKFVSLFSDGRSVKIVVGMFFLFFIRRVGVFVGTVQVNCVKAKTADCPSKIEFGSDNK